MLGHFPMLFNTTLFSFKSSASRDLYGLQKTNWTLCNLQSLL